MRATRPVGASAILADVICPAWPRTLPLFPRVKGNTCTVLAKQEWATLGSTKYVGGNCTASISLLAKARLCQWVGQFLALCGSGHFDDVISGRSEASCILIAEPKGEASNRDALSSPVCIYVCMYVCIYVYPSQSTRDT